MDDDHCSNDFSRCWHTLSRQVVSDQSPWLVVEQHTVELPYRRQIPDWTWINTPDYINVVVPITTGNLSGLL